MRIQRITSQSAMSDDNQENIDITLMDPIIEKYKNVRGNLIPLLQHTQEIYGYLPRIAFLKLEKETTLKLSDMFGVASFYAQFRMKPIGKNIIKICHGTACHVQNAVAISEALEEELCVKDGETTKDGIFTLETVACLGCCSLAPVMMIGEDTYGKLSDKKVKEIIKNVREKEIENCRNN